MEKFGSTFARAALVAASADGEEVGSGNAAMRSEAPARTGGDSLSPQWGEGRGEG
jgi:hypothetical protein